MVRVDDEFFTQLFNKRGAVWLNMDFLFHSGISAGFPAASARKEKNLSSIPVYNPTTKRQLESISLKFTCPADLCSSSLFNFMVRCGDSGTLFQRIISIVPGRVYKVIAHENLVNHVAPVDKFTFCYTKVTLGCSAKWLFVMYLLLKYRPSLMSVVITDLNKPWTLVLKDKQLIAMRNSMFSKGRILGNMAPTEKKSGVLSELFLPISRYVMMDVNFEIEDVKLPSHSGSSRDCVTCKNESSKLVSEDVMIWEFVGDKKIINEAVHEILDKLDG